ncbi:MAG TPA: hypothetical protein VEU07_17185, partial [Candidatus Acidoferrum sp.]|nr:hypothetical protein [Candidatus Acidoferrum sp.]
MALGAGATLALWSKDGSASLSADAACRRRCCAALLPAILLFTWLAGLSRPRHLVPLYSVLPLGLAAVYGRIRALRVWAGHTVLATLLIAGGWDLMQGARMPSGLTLTPLMQGAQRLGIRGLYSEYEVAYRLMFASHETILTSPTAWAQDVISDRTPQITKQVDRLPNPAYVFRRNSAETAWFAQGLARRGIASNHLAAGPLELFSDLSRPIRSTDLPVGPGW